MKLKKRFVLNSKEDFEKDARLRRILTLTALISAVIVPLINDGVIYTLVEYTSADIAVLWLNYILRYTVVTLRYICVFVSFAAVFTGIFHYGYKTFKTPSVILIAGSIVKYIFAQFGSYVFCYEHGFIYSAEVTNAAAIIFNYLFLAVFEFFLGGHGHLHLRQLRLRRGPSGLLGGTFDDARRAQYGICAFHNLAWHNAVFHIVFYLSHDNIKIE